LGYRKRGNAGSLQSNLSTKGVLESGNCETEKKNRQFKRGGATKESLAE